MKYIKYILLTALILTTSHAQYSTIRLGIVPFFDSNKKSTNSSKSKQLTADLTDTLHKYKFIKLVERAEMKNVVREVELGMTGLVNERTAVKAGKIHGIQVMITGTIHGNRITGRAIHVETGKIISTSSAYGMSNVEKLCDKLASGIETFLAKENLKRLRNDSPDIKLDFRVERIGKRGKQNIRSNKTGKVIIGEKVVFHFKSSKSGYITIIDIQPGGDVVILFPNQINPSNRITAGRLYSIPSEDDSFEITVSEPAGRDTIVAYFTKKRVEWLDIKKLSGEGFWTVKKYKKFELTRGFQITATKLKRDEWESSVIEIDVYK